MNQNGVGKNIIQSQCQGNSVEAKEKSISVRQVMSKKQVMIPFQGERNFNLGMLEWISCKLMLVVGGQMLPF